MTTLRTPLLILAVLGCVAAPPAPLSTPAQERARDFLAASKAINIEAVAVLEAIRNNNLACAICLLESQIETDIALGKALLDNEPSRETRQTLEPSLWMVVRHREAHPWKPEDCPIGVCRDSK